MSEEMSPKAALGNQGESSRSDSRLNGVKRLFLYSPAPLIADFRYDEDCLDQEEILENRVSDY